MIAPLTIDTVHITKRGNITFFILKQAIAERCLDNQTPITTMPKTSARDPKITCDHTVREAA